jgi:DNA polymerase-1
LVDDLNRLADNEFYAPEEVQCTKVEKVTSLPKRFAWDLETSTLSPFKGKESKILCVSWSCSNNRAYVSTDIDGFSQQLAINLYPNSQTPTTALVGHNTKFDLLWLRQIHRMSLGPLTRTELQATPQSLFHDTMILAQLLDENRPLALEDLALKYTGYGRYGHEVEALKRKGRMAEVPEELLFKYAAYDAAATWRLWRELSRDLSRQSPGLRQLYAAKMRQVLMLVEMEFQGFGVDIGGLDALKTTLEHSIRRLSASIKRVLGPVNPDSQQGLSEALYGTLGFQPVGKTPKGRLKVNETALTELLAKPYHQYQAKPALQHVGPRAAKALVAKVLERRGLKKQLSTWLEGGKGVRVNMDEHGRVHPNFKITGTVTGRLSCSTPNLQNVPRESNAPIKGIFQAPRGRCLVAADYSQIELRIAAYVTRDARMLDAFRKGRDLHTETARQILGRDPQGDERARAKTVNFSIFYGAGPKNLAAQTGMSVREASRYISMWYAAYPGVKAWQQEIEKVLLQTGQVESIFGRVRHLPPAPGNREQYLGQLRQACNFPIQSAAGELTLKAMCRIEECLPRHASIVCTVHDSIIVECGEGDVRKVTKTLQRTMQDASGICQSFGYEDIEIDVPTPVEVKWGKSWGDMNDL